MMIRFERTQVERIDWRARVVCPFCKNVGGSHKISHLGVGYGFNRKRDGSEVPIRAVLTHGCEWHMRMWAKGRLRVP